MASHFEQLPLGLVPEADATFDNYFVSDRNGLLINQLKHQAEGVGEQWLYLYGLPGSGRSHLLQACCHHNDGLGRQSRYLPLAELIGYEPEALLEGAEQLDLLCLDGIDAVLGQPAWEAALFHCYNRALAAGTALLVAAAQPASALVVTLADLRSRLQSFSIYQLYPLSDEERLRAMAFRADCLGLALSEGVAEYIHLRCRRGPGEIFSVLHVLDRQSLIHQRRLTVPFVKSVMGW